MTTAHERAREAADFAAGPYKSFGKRRAVERAADAASDVWVPLLRNLVKSLPSKDQAFDRHSQYHISDCACTQLDTCLYHAAIQQAKEALGE